VSADFVAAMEEVLDLYEEPTDPKRPRVCFDETPKQLVAETKMPLHVAPGRAALYDYEYRRNGTCNLFLFFDLDEGWRHIAITDHRTQIDFAHQMKWLVDERYPNAAVIRVILDNLNTHKAASLYAAFEPAEARRILKRLEFHYTPKHGSWLNMAEIELSVFNRECWNRRIGDVVTLTSETQALENERNAAHATVHWRFTSRDARVKLQRLYPSIPN
jgi:hypothetical protein